MVSFLLRSFLGRPLVRTSETCRFSCEIIESVVCNVSCLVQGLGEVEDGCVDDSGSGNDFGIGSGDGRNVFKTVPSSPMWCMEEKPVSIDGKLSIVVSENGNVVSIESLYPSVLVRVSSISVTSFVFR